MFSRTTVLGLIALCLALTAAWASAASAGTTAFTCVQDQGAANTNADCEAGTSGKFGHVAIASNTVTTLVHKSLSTWLIEGKLFGATVGLSATGVECVGCTIENTTVGGVMEVTGSGGKLKFTGVTVVGTTGCTVVGSATGEITTTALKFTTTSSTGVTFEPVSGTTLAVFDITGSMCVLKGTGFTTSGKVPATLNGARLSVNVTKASGSITLEGEKAALKGEGTLEVGSGLTRYPMSLTTA